jgi:hypothetical protein
MTIIDDVTGDPGPCPFEGCVLDPEHDSLHQIKVPCPELRGMADNRANRRRHGRRCDTCGGLGHLIKYVPQTDA